MNFEYDCPECGRDLTSEPDESVICRHCKLVFETELEYGTYLGTRMVRGIIIDDGTPLVVN